MTDVMKLRLLEGFGYVGAIMVLAGGLSEKLEMMQLFGVALIAVVLVRLAARTRKGDVLTFGGLPREEPAEEPATEERAPQEPAETEDL
jgi:hypothetical protein